MDRKKLNVADEPLSTVDQEKSYDFDFTNADRENLKKILAVAKGSLLPQEEYVINARFGLTTNGVTQKPPQIAKQMRITTDRVNSLIRSATAKLRNNPKLKDYYTYSESATAGSTSSGNIATVLPTNKTMIRRGAGGAPVAAQHKNKDGTVKNALDVNTNIFGGKPVTTKRKTTNEALAELAPATDMDHEVQMARAELYKLAEYAIKLHNLLKNVSETEGLEGWVQSKITKASDYISSVYHHLEYQEMEAATSSPIRMPAAEGVDPYKDQLRAKLEEKAKSKAQQKFMGMVYAAKKGEKPASKEVAKVAKGMSKKSAKDFAATKHKGKPEHVKKDK